MAREGKITDKDMTVLREGDRTYAQRERGYGVMRDYSGQHRIEIRWDLNAEAIRDSMAILKVDDMEMVIDKEEMMRYLRWA